jgi:prepilin-type N-terminal cleavage/methylation domain-containing protein
MNKGFTLVETLVTIAVVGIVFTVIIAMATRQTIHDCANGDNESCTTLDITQSEAIDKLGDNYKPKDKTTKDSCSEELASCRYECADNAFPSDLDDCLRRCDIKSEYCNLNK